MKVLYDTHTQTLLPWPRIDDETVLGLESHLLEMTVIQESEPTFNSKTQILEPSHSIDIDARTVTRSWNVANLPQTTHGEALQGATQQLNNP